MPAHLRAACADPEQVVQDAALAAQHHSRGLKQLLYQYDGRCSARSAALQTLGLLDLMPLLRRGRLVYTPAAGLIDSFTFQLALATACARSASSLLPGSSITLRTSTQARAPTLPTPYAPQCSTSAPQAWWCPRRAPTW